MATDCCGPEVPQTLVNCQVQVLSETSLDMVTSHLEKLMAEYSRTPLSAHSKPAPKAILQMFKIKSQVEINMRDYMKRIKKYTKFEEPIFVAALMLLERAISVMPELKNSNCIHKYFFLDLSNPTKAFMRKRDPRKQDNR
jgi:hypothetical protein